jgi:putative NIF3 family GTP cyclohydrolase 1 type 2
MTTKQIYDLAIQLGISHDLRGQAKVQKNLERVKKNYAALPKSAQAEFDQGKFTNPYSDSLILVDNGHKQVKKVLVGIDMEGPELLVAKQLGDIDLVIAHHPEGPALADLSDVMHLQAQVLADYGVPINVAEAIDRPRISEVQRGLSPVNHDRSVDIARLLGLDFMCVHTPADNLAADFLIKLLKKKDKEIETVGDVMDLLKTIPEYQAARLRKAGPMIFIGAPDHSCGKVVVTEFTGGTNGSKDIYEKMAQYGIGTIISMHMSEPHRLEAEKHHINVIVAGHMASDSLGMNLFLDEVEKKGVKIVPVSGLIRVKRFKK